MKTKIIYISGSEIFNMNDVRNAFETVRHELGLSQDTILFGVPVDADDALNGQFEPVPSQTFVPEPKIVEEQVITTEAVIDDAPVDIAEPVVAPAPEKKSKKTKKKVTEKEIKEEKVVVPEQPAVVDVPEEKEIIPILSVLGGEKSDDNTQETTEVIDTDDNAEIDIAPENKDINDNEIESAITIETTFETADIQDDIPTIEPQTTTLQEQDDEDDQLEKLLQSVQSLNEDKEEPISTEPELKVLETTPDETDATLEKLATEFAENQDKIVNTTKNTTRAGRIGKLKNILPFKKAKTSDSSLMGDLFGWAGVAANDEEFGIPEFFPTR